MRISDWSSDVCSSDLQRGDRLDLLGVCAEAARVSDEIDLGQHLVTRVGEQIVEGGAAGRGLKAVNATEATIVEQHEDQFDAQDRKSVVEGKRVSVRVDLGVRRFIIKTIHTDTNKNVRHYNNNTCSRTYERK